MASSATKVATGLPMTYEVIKKPQDQNTKVTEVETVGRLNNGDPRTMPAVPNQYTELPGETSNPQQSPYANSNEVPGGRTEVLRTSNRGTSYGYVDDAGYAEINVL